MMLSTTVSSPSNEPTAVVAAVPATADARAAEPEPRRAYRKPLVVTHSREELDQAAAKVNACVSF
jgi:hypothetical protein